MAQVRSAVSNAWWILVLQGFVAIILGILMVSWPAATLEVVVLYIGFFLLLNGIFALTRMFTVPSSWFWSLLNGIIGVLAGFFILRHPVYSFVLVPTTLVIILAILGLVMGLIDLARGIQGDGAGAFVLGGLNILIGIWLFMHPLFAAAALPVVLGILGIAGGFVAIFYALRLRSVVNQMGEGFV